MKHLSFLAAIIVLFAGGVGAPAFAQQVSGAGPAVANPSGGASIYSAQGGTGNALFTGTAVQIGTTAAHSLYGVQFANVNASDVFCQAFDVVSGSVTLGTTVPKLVWRVPGGSSTNAGFWEEKFAGEGKIAFSTAITIACTTTATGSTAPATGVSGVLVYQ